MIVGYAANFTVFLNQRQLKEETDFCVAEYKSVSFNFSDKFVVTTLPEN